MVDHVHFVETPAATRPWARAIVTPSNGDIVRLVGLLFIAPNAMLAASFEWPAMALVWIGCAGAVFIRWRARGEGAFAETPADLRRLALCLAFGFLLCIIGGEGHFFYTERDWLMRDAVLGDLVRSGASALYRDGAVDYMMRAPLGIYLLPSAVGRIAGLDAAHVAFLSRMRRSSARPAISS